MHEKNMELLRAGVVNAWTEKSLAGCELVPGRYAKDEMSSGFLGSIDSYAYRAAAAPVRDRARPRGRASRVQAPQDGAEHRSDQRRGGGAG